jgi:hypothetical protein
MREKQELVGVGEKFRLHKDGRHFGKAQHGQVGLLDPRLQ